MYKVCFYVPSSHVDEVKRAMFAAGAGKVGNYSCCAWQSLGEGQFMPLEGSNAYIGEENQLETVQEFKVEMICDASQIKEAIAALKKSHPYEVPAYQMWRVETE